MMKAEQIKVLNDELKSAGYISSWSIARRRVRKTAVVKAAERLTKQHEASVQRERNKLDRAFAALKAKARHAIYFGDEKQATLAVRAVHKFQMDHS